MSETYATGGLVPPLTAAVRIQPDECVLFPATSGWLVLPSRP